LKFKKKRRGKERMRRIDCKTGEVKDVKLSKIPKRIQKFFEHEEVERVEAGKHYKSKKWDYKVYDRNDNCLTWNYTWTFDKPLRIYERGR